MAKTSVKARQRKRERMVLQHAVKRAELKKAGDWKALDELPKNSSKVRLKNRCQLSGRPKGYVRYFGISKDRTARYGTEWKDTRAEKSKLVNVRREP